MEKDYQTARKLSRLYITALTVIAILVISGALLVQKTLERQTTDSRVVNIAGRQRMLSQKLVKEALRADQLSSGPDYDVTIEKISETLRLWDESYRSLLHGSTQMGLPGMNSETVLSMFREIEEPFNRIRESASRIVKVSGLVGENQARTIIHEAVEIMLHEEARFLQGMDRIVFQYDLEAKARVELSKKIEWGLLWAALCVLLLEGLFIFRPAVRKLSRTLVRLKAERGRAEGLAARLQVQNRKLDKALTEILDVSEQERQRIAQDLHDRLAQEISGISCMTRAVHHSLQSRGAEETTDMDEINGLITTAISHTREIARGLYPITIDGDGLLEKLEDLTASVEKIFRIQCRLDSDVRAVPLSRQGATHLYCIAQEAIHNSIRHGKAKGVWLSVTNDDEHIRVSVSDDGVGFMPDKEGYKGLGLRIMKYRAELINGELDFTKSRHGGATVTCKIKKGTPHGSYSENYSYDCGRSPRYAQRTCKYSGAGWRICGLMAGRR